MGKTNKAWHLKHPMPKNPTVEQRLAWHLKHAKACACRPMPPSLKARLRKLG
jgi:hypothetical protein